MIKDNRVKRTAALGGMLACLALSAGMACAPVSAWASSFSDVRGHWAEADGWIDYASSKGLMTGYSGTSNFGPDDYLTRAQVATVLYRIAGGKPAGNPGFPDVASGTWYYNAISWCKANGIITGYPEDGTFRPDAPVRRAELATMVYRFAKWSGANVSANDEAYYETLDTGLLDRPGNAYSYARDALVWTCDKGVLNGKFDTQGYAWIDAQATATRGEAAKIFSVLKRDVVDRSGSYTVTFNSTGGNLVAAQKLTSGKKAVRPADPTRKGYTFVNWYSDKALTRVFNFASDVTGNVTAYAKWQAGASAHDLDETGETVAGASADTVEPTYDDVVPEMPVAPEVPAGSDEPAAPEGGEAFGDAETTPDDGGDGAGVPVPGYDEVVDGGTGELEGAEQPDSTDGDAASDPNETEVLPIV